MTEEDSERRSGEDLAGGHGPQALRFGEVRSGDEDDLSGRSDGTSAWSALLAERAVIRPERPRPRAVQPVAEGGLSFNFFAGGIDSRLRLGGVTGLSAAHGTDDPSDGGGPLVVAPSEEGEGAEANLVQKANGELA